MNTFLGGSGSGCTLMPRDCATPRAIFPRSDSANPYTVGTFNGIMGKNMSMLMSATMDFGSTVGFAVKYFEPSKPFSSPVTNTNKIDRLSFSGDFFSEDEMSSNTALPEPLSIAPL